MGAMETHCAKRISAFDIDALREAFKTSARENGVTGTEWAVFAQIFLKQTTTEFSEDIFVASPLEGKTGQE
ncbi:hypothetical protein EH240_12555 [Mesorhizobium tamadayense]|uniref:Uncharacterized protein n=1 Tax=Mesorhizobium tamadayense TaxID=425306 RepID=A0A3P3FW26_9HYPH|nr:hypothetical protein [Mesorhizobium tamadayense]RRI02293.1 hypothetical protein EH240_12555 [Mesorhizobium tamadayense]